MTSTSTTQPPVTDISPQTFVELNPPPTLIDVRSQLEYRMGHAPNAVNLSLPRLLLGSIPGLRRWVLPQWFWDLPKDEPVAVVCLTAHRSPIAARQLANVGFQQVYNITGGMMEWQRSGLETRTGKSSE
jgi:rhodanese-related sulfurtransferase